MQHQVVIILGIVLSCFSCNKESNTQAKGWFLTNNLTPYRVIYEKEKGFLISSIFDAQWAIAYYIYSECNFNKKQSDELQQGIKDAVETWLKPIRDVRGEAQKKRKIISSENIRAC